jgi:homoserine dehydrogenase
MTRHILILQLGVGRVGREVVALVRRQASTWRTVWDLDVRYEALADSTGIARVPTAEAVARALSATGGERLAAWPGAVSWDQWSRVLEDALVAAGAPADLVVLDCATGPGTTPLLLAARRAGAHVVLANKDPLVGPLEQFRALWWSSAGGTLHCSATVGAGLPVISTLAGLAASGDTLLELGARASGSLGFLCDRLSSGLAFDAAVREAEALGYTEPDARQDLSGFDVARKLLILARVAGRAVELADVNTTGLVPPGLEDVPLEVFHQRLGEQHAFLAERVQAARAGRRALRYIGQVGADGTLSAGLVDLPPDAPLAVGGGPENVFVLRTTRYDQYPLRIAGPGAGVTVTAGAVVADLLRAVGVIS